jgi:hypothetical protein
MIWWLGSRMMLPVLSRWGVLPSMATRVSEVYLRLYYELPVFEGILCAYFEGRGTSETLTEWHGEYSCPGGRTRSCPAISEGPVRSGNAIRAPGWQVGSRRRRLHCDQPDLASWKRERHQGSSCIAAERGCRFASLSCVAWRCGVLLRE